MKKKPDNKQKIVHKKDYIKLLPVALILAIVPLIVFMKKITLTEAIAKLWKGSTVEADFFVYYKMVWFIALTCISVIFILYYIATKKIKLTFQKIFIPLSIYIFFVFLSSSFSGYHSVALMGFPERYEGFFTILCYVLVCFIVSQLVTSDFDFKYLLSFLAFSVIVLSILGITQFFGFDFLQTSFGKHLILPSANENLAASLDFKFPEQYIYSTLYNPNYVGGYFAMILPVSLIIFLSLHKVQYKIIAGIFCILSFINLLGSLSSTGWISAIVAAIALLLLMRKDLKRNLVPLIAIFLCFGATAFFMNYTSQGKIFGELKVSDNFNIENIKTKVFALINLDDSNTTVSNSIVKQAAQNMDTNKSELQKLDFQPTVLKSNLTGNVQSMDLSSSTSPTLVNVSTDSPVPTEIKDIKIDKDSLILYTTETDTLIIKFDPVSSELSFLDNNDKSLDISTNETSDKYEISFSDSRFKDIKILTQSSKVSVQAPNTSFNLIITKDGFKFITPSGRITDIVTADSFGFKGRETWGSYRGYIWSRSVPMLKDTFLLGHGPDTYAIYFPQNDYVAKMNYTGNIYLFVDKPHNLYLQIALNSGILSLIAFLIFMAWYCIASLKLYLKKNNNEYFIPGVTCFVVVISFLVSSIANDSTVSVSPLFWILLGTGIAFNRLYAKKLATV